MLLSLHCNWSQLFPLIVTSTHDIVSCLSTGQLSSGAASSSIEERFQKDLFWLLACCGHSRSGIGELFYLETDQRLMGRTLSAQVHQLYNFIFVFSCIFLSGL